MLKHSQMPAQSDLVTKARDCQNATFPGKAVLKLSPVKMLSQANRSIPTKKQALAIEIRFRIGTATARTMQNSAAPNANAFTIWPYIVCRGFAA